MHKVTNIETALPLYIALEGEKVSAEDIPEASALIISSKGLHIKRTNSIYMGIFPMKSDSIFGEVDDTVYEAEVPMKIPVHMFMSIESFFRKIYDSKKSEVAVILYYNTVSGKWGYAIPSQEVSGSSVSYKIDESTIYVHEDNLSHRFDDLLSAEDGKWIQVGSIHSHANMTAFHSGVDDADEFGFDGIHITIGKFGGLSPEYACSLVCSGTRIKKEVHEVVHVPIISGEYPAEAEGNVSEKKYQYQTAGKGWQGWQGHTTTTKNYGTEITSTSKRCGFSDKALPTAKEKGITIIRK